MKIEKHYRSRMINAPADLLYTVLFVEFLLFDKRRNRAGSAE